VSGRGRLPSVLAGLFVVWLAVQSVVNIANGSPAWLNIALLVCLFAIPASAVVQAAATVYVLYWEWRRDRAKELPLSTEVEIWLSLEDER